MTLYLSPNLYGLQPSLEPVDTVPPKDEAVPREPKPGERSAAQLVNNAIGYAAGYGIGLTYAGPLASLAGACSARPAVLPSTFATYRLMDLDATIGLAIAAADAPVESVRLSWEAGKNAPADALEFLRDMLDPMWPDLCSGMLTARSMGFFPGELVFEDDAGATVLNRVKALLPELTTIRYHKDTGGFAGFRNEASRGPDGRGVVLPPEKCLLYTHRRIGDNHRGLSQHENSRVAHSNWLASTDNGFRAQRKISGVIVQLHYPPGTTDVAGTATENATIAQTILDNVQQSNGVAMPNLLATEDYARRQNGLDGKPQWILSTVDAGNASALTELRDDAKYWDTLKLRGWLVPERAVTEGQFGTKAEAEAHGDILLAVSEKVAGRIVRTLNEQLINPLLVWNYGPEAKGAVWATAEPIVDKNRAVLKELLMALIADPAIRTDVRRQVQLRGPLEQFGFGLQENLNIDEEAAEIPDAQTRAKEALANAQALKPPPTNGNGKPGMNGNGRPPAGLRLSRGLAFLGDIAGGDGDDDDPPFALSAGGNCGTGAGGFQPGNRCQIGGGGTATAEAVKVTGDKAGFNRSLAVLGETSGILERRASRITPGPADDEVAWADGMDGQARVAVGKNAEGYAATLDAAPTVADADKGMVAKSLIVDLQQWPAEGRAGIKALADKAGRLDTDLPDDMILVAGKGDAGKALRRMQGEVGAITQRGPAERAGAFADDIYERLPVGREVGDATYKRLTPSTWLRSRNGESATLVEAGKVPT